MDLVNFFELKKKLHIQIIAITLKVTSCKTMSKKKSEKKWKTKILWENETSFLAPCPPALGQFQPHGYMQELIRKYQKNELNTHFQQKWLIWSRNLRSLNVHRKLVKYVVHSSERKELIFFLKFFTLAAQIAINQFLVKMEFQG